MFFVLVNLKDFHQLGELQNFPHRLIQAEQDETGADIARGFQTFHQRRYAGAVNVANGSEVEHDARHL